MRPIAPRTGAPEQTIAEDQPEYQPITIGLYPYTDGSLGMLCRFTFTAEERAAIAAGEDVYVMQLSFNAKFAPLHVQCGPKGLETPVGA